ncbi:uncharacterized protein LOC106180756 [Lingula anatina]|uniref:Uncharacterized protein LOC106180756 n=1 Tax=Lingula anatina TaxID=7574 RepID=A0A1S3KCF2_LINAN|nr:uncharacterized protein LOC106180756 [Lingula anatina]|eukprot:XP_013420315.1 uncharacterized protein LOC106180756 [Lingula anatina]
MLLLSMFPESGCRTCRHLAITIACITTFLAQCSPQISANNYSYASLPANEWVCEATSRTYARLVCRLDWTCQLSPYRDCCQDLEGQNDTEMLLDSHRSLLTERVTADWKTDVTPLVTKGLDPRLETVPTPSGDDVIRQTAYLSRCIPTRRKKAGRIERWDQKKAWHINRCMNETHKFHEHCTMLPAVNAPWSILPVSHKPTGLTYSNIYCGLCNGRTIQELSVWSPFVHCQGSPSDFLSGQSLDTLANVWNSSVCSVRFREENALWLRQCWDKEDFTSTCVDQELESVCSILESDDGDTFSKMAMSRPVEIATYFPSALMRTYLDPRCLVCEENISMTFVFYGCSAPDIHETNESTKGNLEFSASLTVTMGELMGLVAMGKYNNTSCKDVYDKNNKTFQTQCDDMKCSNGSNAAMNTCHQVFHDFTAITIWKVLTLQIYGDCSNKSENVVHNKLPAVLNDNMENAKDTHPGKSQFVKAQCIKRWRR